MSCTGRHLAQERCGHGFSSGRAHPRPPALVASRSTKASGAVRMELAPALDRNWGPTLADLRARLGGSDQGEFTDPRFRSKHAVDLRPWSQLPPNTHFKFG